jgi:hypothetical protein
MRLEYPWIYYIFLFFISLLGNTLPVPLCLPQSALATPSFVCPAWNRERQRP